MLRLGHGKGYTKTVRHRLTVLNEAHTEKSVEALPRCYCEFGECAKGTTNALPKNTAMADKVTLLCGLVPYCHCQSAIT